MRRSQCLLRGAKGYGWYTKFMEKGQDGFRRHLAPTPFDWSIPEGSPRLIRPRAFFNIALDKEHIGRLDFELASDVVPKTVENFKLLCEGKGKRFPGYSGTKMHRVIKNEFIMGGDIEFGDGRGSHSALESRYFPDENYIIPHTSRGLLSMASVGVNTNGSQFYLSLSPDGNEQLNGRCVVFGRLLGGNEVLAAIEKLFTFRGTPARSVVIESCGVYTPTEEELQAEKSKASAKDKTNDKDGAGQQQTQGKSKKAK